MQLTDADKKELLSLNDLLCSNVTQAEIDLEMHRALLKYIEMLIDACDAVLEEIPLGFKKYEGGGCPVPENCSVEVILFNGDTLTMQAHRLTWITELPDGCSIKYYKVTQVPRLTRDDFWDMRYCDYWLIEGGEIVVYRNTWSDIDAEAFDSPFALASEEHAKAAIEWGV